MSITSISPSRAAGRHGALRRLRQAGMVGVYKEEADFNQSEVGSSRPKNVDETFSRTFSATCWRY